MNVATVVAVMSAALSVYVAALSLSFSRAPGWRDQRWFAVAAVTASAYSALNVPVMLSGTSVAATLAVTRVQVLIGGLHVASWTRYAAAYLQEPPGRVARWTSACAVGIGLIALVPGAVYEDRIHLRTYQPLLVEYRDPVTTGFGDVALLVLAACFVPIMVRFVLAGRRGVPHAGTQAAAIGVLLCLVVNDVLAVAGVLPTPYLIDLAYVFPIAVVGYVLTARFAGDARALAAMRSRLETMVAERTLELGRAQEALHRSEKLAALGQLAAGVAHEVSNPAAVVAANLGYLEQRFEAGLPVPDGLECVRESSRALGRVSTITRQLLQAGQLAAGGSLADRVAVAAVARDAVATARARCPAHVTLVVEVAEDLWAAGQHEMVHQVLVNLLLNGAQAVPEARRGTVVIRAQRAGGRVLVVVEDDGDGMPPQVLRRVFEPFFTTKPFGSGTGLGLAVSRGLVTGLGGELRLESQVGSGTRAFVELPEAEAAPGARPASKRA